jgi:hypothetical protein
MSNISRKDEQRTGAVHKSAADSQQRRTFPRPLAVENVSYLFLSLDSTENEKDNGIFVEKAELFSESQGYLKRRSIFEYLPISNEQKDLLSSLQYESNHHESIERSIKEEGVDDKGYELTALSGDEEVILR